MFFTINLFTQEVLSDLILNPYLTDKNNVINHKNKNAIILPFIDDFSYELMAKDLKHYCDYHNITNCYIIGHSMGGKTAMLFAIENPLLVEKLIVADIAPKIYPAHHQYILKALQEVNFDEHNTRSSIEEVLQEYIAEKNLN